MVRKRNNEEVNNYISNINKNIEDNIRYVKEEMGDSGDLVIRQFKLGKNLRVNAALIYIEGLVDKRFIQSFMTEITNKVLDSNTHIALEKNLLEYLVSLPLSAGKAVEIFDFETLLL